MNNIPKIIIELVYKYLSKRTNNVFRQCSKCLSNIIGSLYFSNTNFRVHIIEKQKHLFRYFVHKYKLTISITNITNIRTLAYFSTYQLKSIKLNLGSNNPYSEYFLKEPLQKLKYGFFFNNQINKKLPSTLRTLKFDRAFNYPINKKILPINLKELILSSHFNEPYLFPLNLEILIFGNVFNQEIITLPETLKTLIFGDDFNNTIKKFPNLETLIFGENFNRPILSQLPSTLITLKFGFAYNELIFENTLEKLFPNLQNFAIDHTIHKHYKTVQKIQQSFVGLFPPTLKILEWNRRSIEPNILPNLHTLVLGNSFINPIDENIFPSTLQNIKFGDFYNKPILQGIFPASLITLIFGRFFNQPIEKHVLPPLLKNLTFGEQFNQLIEETILPSKLTTLIFGERFDQSLKKNVLPTTLEILMFGQFYSQDLDWNVLPTSLYYICFYYEKTLKDLVPPDYGHIEVREGIAAGHFKF